MGTRLLTLAKLAQAHRSGMDVRLLLFGAQVAALVDSNRVYQPMVRMSDGTT